MSDVLLISVDAMRHDAIAGGPDMTWWDRQGLAGLIRTPNLDRVAAGSHVFTRCYATAGLTPPSHASLLTGRHVFRHGVRSFFHVLRPDIPTLATILKARGYATIAWHEHECLEYCGILRGFDRIYGYEDHAWAEFVAAVKDAGRTHPKRRFVLVHVFDLHSPYMVSLRDLGQPGEVGRWFDRLNGVLQEEGCGRAGWLARVLTPEARSRMADGRISRQKAFEICRRRERLVRATVGTERAVRLLARAYAHGVTLFDQRWWPELEAGLRDAGLMSEDCLTILTGDHGDAPCWYFGDYAFQHGTALVEGVIRVPLLISRPRVEQARVASDTPVSLVDIAPAVLGALGISAEGVTFDGVDILNGSAEERPLFAEADYFRPSGNPRTGPTDQALGRRSDTCLSARAVISGGLKLIRRGDAAALQGIEKRRPEEQVEAVYRGILGRLPTQWEAAVVRRLLVARKTTIHELLDAAREAVEAQGGAEELVSLDDPDSGRNLIADPERAEVRRKLGALLDAYSAEAQAAAPYDAGCRPEDEGEVVARLRDLGYL